MQFNNNRKVTLRRLALACLMIGQLGVAAEPRPRVSADRLREDIRILAGPEMRGRGAGTPGLERAGLWIASQFKQIGLKPAGDNGTYQQTFSITSGASLGETNSLSCTGCGTAQLEAGKDFTPLPMSASASLDGDLVFAGYGITAPECGYDDYKGIDVRGRVVLILRHEPREFDSKSIFDGRVYTEHAQTMKKVMTAQEHGAAAILLVNDTAAHSGSDTLEPFTALPGPGGAQVPVIQVHPRVAGKWFTDAGRELDGVQSSIDSTMEPHSFLFSGMRIELRTDVHSTQVPAFNVAGYLPGGNHSEEYVIVGAHYDHLGFGEQYSLAQEKAGTAHPGADDNASGTAGMIELARWLALQAPLRRGVLFVAFSGEEIGLLGSTHYTAHPLLPMDRAVAMLNMDMIGRLRDRKLTVGGASSAAGLRAILEQLGPRFSLDLKLDEDAVYGSSDHTAFKARSIPVLFFFTGLHADYHRPTDTVDKIDTKATARVVEFAGAVAVNLAQRSGRLAFARSSEINALAVPGLGR